MRVYDHLFTELKALTVLESYIDRVENESTAHVVWTPLRLSEPVEHAFSRQLIPLGFPLHQF